MGLLPQLRLRVCALSSVWFVCVCARKRLGAHAKSLCSALCAYVCVRMCAWGAREGAHGDSERTPQRNAVPQVPCGAQRR